MSNFKGEDGLTVHPTELNIPFEWNKMNSCRIQLTNKTNLLLAYRFSCSWWRRLLVYPGEDTYVGTILPQSTSSVRVTLKLTREHQFGKHRDWVNIWAYVVKDGVKAEDITSVNFYTKTSKTFDSFELPVVYIRAKSSSAVPEKNEKGKSLLDDHNNNCISDKVHGTTSESKGPKSTIMRQSSNEISIKLFSDNEIKFATNGLSDSSKIGQGGYGAVYKGNLHDTEVAIKMLDPNSQQGIDEFLQEMEVLGRMRHPNLVKLIGACFKLRALVYEFLPHGSVEDYLKKNPRLLTWQMRTRIVYEICSALTFLHSIKPQPVVHGDLKPANILLDANFISKLADFGLCRFIPEGTTTVAFLDTKPKGTFGYIDPEFMRTGILTPGCDVYSFGVTILRLLTGTDALGISTKVRIAYKEKSLMTLLDSTAGHWPADVSELLAYFGLKCCAKKKSHGLMKEIAGDLKEILAEISG
ncbi:putative U-box domain-containing protein 33 isoform X2 [Iris pallida]|uniref:RING-type E3 ubiquitin transferase n=1 Tax=Iris pallida TaxID=29817 RepID=A0AAX6GQN5_IRIPA|nr:putative U-box domain-containing protein 33 isoform X2 [Iris pallida]